MRPDPHALPRPAVPRPPRALRGSTCAGPVARLVAAFVASAGATMPAAAQTGGADLFAPVASVLENPRCMNCHPRGDIPLQTDARRVHQMNVRRGPDDQGAPGAPCAACHGAANHAVSGVPGAPHWQLAPLSMGWQGLDRGALCRVLVDPAMNGGRDLAELVEHMSADPLVLWGWAPGGDRAPVTPAHPQFVVALKAWADAGGPCPD